MGRFILIVLILLFPSVAFAGGCVDFSDQRTFTIDERFVFVVSAILSEETTKKLLEVHHGVLSDHGIEEIALERSKDKGPKWFLKIKYEMDARVRCIPIHIDVAMELDRRNLELTSETLDQMGRIQKSAMAFKIKKVGYKTEVAMSLDVTIWRRFPNIFRRKAAQIVYCNLNSALYQSEQIIREAVPITKERILNKASELTEEYLDLLLDSL